MPRKIKTDVGLSALCAILWSGYAHAAPATLLPPGPIGSHLQTYVDAVNGRSGAVEAFSTELSASFEEPHSLGALQRYFDGQHRVTGGITAVGFRLAPGSMTKGQLVFRDTIYGGLRALAVTFDETPSHRIIDISPTPAPGWAIAVARPKSPAQVAMYAATLIDRGCQADVFSGAFLVAHQGKVIVERACGEADKRGHVANNLDTRINLGSINKAFTAVAVAQLAETQRLSLSEPLSDFVDDSWLPQDIARRITVAQLLAMTSGLGSYFDDNPMSRLRENRTLDDYKPLIRAQTLQAAPGQKFIYSDTGYFLLGLVVQKASGENYYEYVRKHIYRPAGMTDTDSFDTEDPSQRLAVGYLRSGDHSGWRENRLQIPRKGVPDGGGYSTAHDLLRFAEALKQGQLV
ncbi:serine hydrolase domain-containing protein, partial [Phenylobacterium sp.]|uniref:serine hydrolase domain-containing protein n=1 Tax=Phenylobacterium sp. TaxID=1871053 RepID=UPI00120AA525